MRNFFFSVILAVFCGLIIRCTHEQTCNNIPQRPTPTPTPLPGATPVPSPTPEPDPNGSEVQKSLSDDTRGPQVQVFKPSGEKQCGQSPGIAIEDMAKQLSQRKIYILESFSQPDGLMHMALCGSPTGKIHVFTILKKDIKRAQAAGFKVLPTHP